MDKMRQDMYDAARKVMDAPDIGRCARGIMLRRGLACGRAVTRAGCPPDGLIRCRGSRCTGSAHCFFAILCSNASASASLPAAALSW